MTREELLLIKLSEECGEVIQNISKTLQFGKDEIYPIQKLTNAERVTQEMQDVLGVFEMLVNNGTLPDLDLTAIPAKKQKVERYLGYSQDLGILKEE